MTKSLLMARELVLAPARQLGSHSSDQIPQMLLVMGL